MISPEDYLTIANIIGGGNDDVANAITDLTQANATLQSIVGADPSAQSTLGGIILQCVTLLQQFRFPNQNMNSAVQALQGHVAKNAGSVNAFLSTHGIKVTQSFANISAYSGYTISAENIAT